MGGAQYVNVANPSQLMPSYAKLIHDSTIHPIFSIGEILKRDKISETIEDPAGKPFEIEALMY